MGVKISELTELTDLQESDVLPIVDTANGATKKIPYGLLKEKMNNLFLDTHKLLDSTTNYVDQYLKLFEINLNVDYKNTFIVFEIADIQNGTYANKYYIDVKKEGTSDELQINDFRKTFEKNTNITTDIFAIIESTNVISIWQKISASNQTPSVKITSNLTYEEASNILNITSDLIQAELPIGTEAKPQEIPIKKWTKLTSYSTSTADKIVKDVENLSNYNEFLMTVSQTGNTYRILASLVIPAEMLFGTTAYNNKGTHQAMLPSSTSLYGGLDYVGNNQLRIWAGAEVSVAIFGR